MTKNSLGAVSLTLAKHEELDLLTGSPACFPAMFHFHLPFSAVFIDGWLFLLSPESCFASPWLALCRTAPTVCSSGEEVPRFGSYLFKTSPTTPQQAGMTSVLFYLIPHTNSQKKKKKSPSIICAKQHKFLANSNDFSIGPEVHLKCWHLLLRILEEAGFSNPDLNTTEKPVHFFLVPHAAYFLFGKLPKSVSGGCYFAPRDQNQSINPWFGGVGRED